VLKAGREFQVLARTISPERMWRLPLFQPDRFSFRTDATSLLYMGVSRKQRAFEG